MKNFVSGFFSLFLLVLLFSTTTSAQNFEWIWQNSVPIGNNYNDITLLPGGAIVGVTDGGAVVRSTDGGTIWTVSYPDSVNGNRSIYEATFLSANIGYACGLDGLVMKTTDGGINWSQSITGSVADFWYIEFVDADTGYVCGTSSALYKTTDGGTTWNPTTLSVSTTLYKIHFVNASTGYIGTLSTTLGRLIRTTDYGATWTNVTGYTATGTTRGIYFVDADTGYVSNSNYAIWKTTDGGTSFTELADFGTGTIYEVKFFNPSTGVAAGGNGDIFVTTNHGATWSASNIGHKANVFGLGLEGFLGSRSAQSIDGAGANTIFASGIAGVIAKSIDLGATWTPVSKTATVQELREITFLNENVGYAVGGSGTTADSLGVVLKTTNGGDTWAALAFNPQFRIYSHWWVNENIGYIGVRGPNGIWKTTDGGASFVNQTPGIGSATSIWYELEFADADNGYASGSSGSLVKTTNGGTPDGMGTSIIYGMHVFDAQNLIIAGGSSLVSRSTDGGATFTPLTAPSPSTTLYTVYFLDHSVGFVGGTSGRAWKTTDGGFTWTLLTTGTTQAIIDFKFLNNDKGWMGGWTGTMLYTTDGGNSWTDASRFNSIGDVQYMTIANGLLWTCGEAGNILRGYADASVPVELLSFNAAVSGNTVQLNWQTASELNNSGFDVERKLSGEQFEKIGFVLGRGTTSDLTNYSFIDENILGGTVTYRLKQIDFDGTSKYSNEVMVDVISVFEYALEQNYPNPFNPVTNISYTIASQSKVLLKIYNSIGEEVVTLVNGVKEPGRYAVSFDAASVSSGVYFYKLQAGDFVSTRKMVLLK
ncbi:MAG: T9SS type A sorting domain-containing protein [Ignavibacteriales bacterium]|nr:MAG: T9SS type A sorting domain-containing protein [Ignavibacteriales bacterium]